MPARRILSPAQMAILVEEDVLPRASQESRASGDGDGDGEEGEVVVAGRVSVAPSAALGMFPLHSFTFILYISYPSLIQST
jgi:hypothetical protein